MIVPQKSKLNFMLPYGCRRTYDQTVSAPRGWWFCFGHVTTDTYFSTYFSNDKYKIRHYYRIEEQHA